MEFVVIDGRTVHELLRADLPGCVEVVREAYLLHQDGATVNPNSLFLRFPERPDSRIIALPAHVGGRFAVSGIKWIASYPQNLGRGLPRASAVLILNNLETGFPYACLEASIISAARTAASAVLGAEALNGGSRRVGSLAVIGTGFIARYTYELLQAMGWEIGRVLLFDHGPGEAARFASGVCQRDRHGEVSVVASIEEALRAGELILFTTTAASPHVTDPTLFAHNPMVLHLSLRDLAPELVLRGQNVVDDIGHVLNAGTSVHLAQQRVGHHRFIDGTLAQALRGEVGRDRNRPAFFSPFGLGVLDLAVGRWIFQRAVEHRAVTRIPDFFFDLTR
jgi:ornithine cyclodeaminase